ncbi:ABC transporter ATP-binding protein [Pusillimonas sp. CC-YST705]|uniref:ABC transporter ATP-binding protein n=1 Tax=Mesopusillimonas faecipullorum TaxID=2755040 RepID=A0ABS8CED4_9BURK|nr:ABC transporter ATP-binding protein [Mesopusillimonas faecipullorum]MCB5364398.1 ABC transporter ATP-binding protein [Mesopusillimonas faecipullorum]
MMSTTPYLEYRDITAGYNGTEVVSQVSFAVCKGQRWGVLGRNGAGKSTTLAAAVGLSQLQAGEILLNGRDIGSTPIFQRSRSGLGFVPQGRDIFPSLSVEENILVAAKNGNASEALDMAYTMFPRLKERRNNGGTQLSGGEQQMLSIARAIVTKPQVLLLDEPLEGLAPKVRQELMASITDMIDELGLACVLVEQYVDVILDFSQHVLVLESGRPVYTGPTEDLRRDHQDIIENAIGLRKL